jgi:outer membrane protein assembly factor BamB
MSVGSVRSVGGVGSVGSVRSVGGRGSLTSHTPDTSHTSHTSHTPHTSHTSCTATLALAALLVLAGPAAARDEKFHATFLTNARAAPRVDRLQQLAAQKQWDDWLTTYQQLVDDANDLVLPRGEELLVGARYHCHQLLAALPIPVRARYRLLYDKQARQLYERAAAEDDPAAMREVYSRYRFSSYAEPALRWIADRASDRGQPELATLVYSRLAQEPTVSPATLIRYAQAAHAAGKADEARAALERVRRDFGANQVRIAGRDVTGAAAYALVLGNLRQDPSPPGAVARSVLSGECGPGRAGSSRPLWQFGLPDHPYLYSPFGRGWSPDLFTFLSFPVVMGDRVWVQSPVNLTALDLSTGKPVGNAPQFLTAAVEFDGYERGRRGEFRPRSRPVQAAPCSGGTLLVTRVPVTHQNATGRLHWPLDLALAAIDVRNGTEVWRRTAGIDGGVTYFNLPVIHTDMVLTGSATTRGGLGEYSAAALDASSGEPLWTTYLGGGSDPLARITDGSPPLVRDGMVWIESSLYTLSALDLISGEIRLISRFDRPHRDRSGEFGDQPYLVRPVGRIVSGPGSILYAPRWDKNVVALDPATGNRLWVTPKTTSRTMLGSLFGADGQRVYLCGDYVQAVGIADGQTAWTWKPQTAAGTVSFPVLAGDRIYVPHEGRIRVLAAADGEELETLDIRSSLGPSPGYASVLPVGDKLLVCTRDRLVAFGPDPAEGTATEAQRTRRE